MKRCFVQILVTLCVAASAHGATPLSVGDVTLIIPGGPCWDDSLLMPPALSATATFTLPGVSGTGVVSSRRN